MPHAKPFLFLASRAEDIAADEEYAAFLRLCGLEEARLERHRLEARPLGTPDLDAYAGILVGGGPFNVSDPPERKSAVQVRVESEMQVLLDQVVARDVPFLGCCYGIGSLGVRDGGAVDRRHAEPIGVARIRLTREGRTDPLFGMLPEEVDVLLGHKEAISRLPRGAVVLASSPACPVQAMRVGRHVRATQFHPELDVPGIHTRIDVYAEYGYFDPAEREAVKARCAVVPVTEPRRLLRRFVHLYGAPTGRGRAP